GRPDPLADHRRAGALDRVRRAAGRRALRALYHPAAGEIRKLAQHRRDVRSPGRFEIGVSRGVAKMPYWNENWTRTDFRSPSGGTGRNLELASPVGDRIAGSGESRATWRLTCRTL